MSINRKEVYVFTVQDASRFLAIDAEEDITKTLQADGFREDHNGLEGLGGGGFLVYAKDPATGEHTARRIIDYFPQNSGTLDQVMEQYIVRDLKAFPNNIIVEQADVPAVMAQLRNYPKHTAYTMKRSEPKTKRPLEQADAISA
jgi:hypothetical protein